MYRGCRYCDYIEFSRFDAMRLKRTILKVGIEMQTETFEMEQNKNNVMDGSGIISDRRLNDGSGTTKSSVETRNSHDENDSPRSER